MPFHPDALDSATLQKLAKNLKKALSASSPSVSLPLSQAQEVLARTLGHPDWHAAIAHTPKEPDPAVVKPAVQVYNVNVTDPALRQALADAGWDPDLVTTPLFDPFRRAQLFSAFSTVCMASEVPIVDAVKMVAKVYQQEGEDDMAHYLHNDWLVSLESPKEVNAVDVIARKMQAYNPKESFVFRLGSTQAHLTGLGRAWGEAARVARLEAERDGDESDYCRLSNKPVPSGNVFNFLLKREPAKPRIAALG